MTENQFLLKLNERFGRRGAEWRVAIGTDVNEAFEKWDGSFFTRRALYRYIKAVGSNSYVIQPYYTNHLITEAVQSQLRRNEWGDALILTVTF